MKSTEGTNQHWLPKCYLRAFRSEDKKDKTYVLDRFLPLAWYETDFSCLTSSIDYHPNGMVDARIDKLLTGPYGESIKIIKDNCSKTSLASEYLDEKSIEKLCRFIDAHYIRTPLYSYKGIYDFLIQTVYPKNYPEFPIGTPVQFRLLVDEIRDYCADHKLYSFNSRDREVVRAVNDLLEQDEYSHTLMKIPEILENAVLSFAQGESVIWRFEKYFIIYSDSAIFTTDNPFWYDYGEDGVTLVVPLTPHHLLYATTIQGTPLPEAVDLLAGLPYFSYSSKIFISAPRDIELLWYGDIPKTWQSSGQQFPREYYPVKLTKMEYFGIDKTLVGKTG